MTSSFDERLAKLVKKREAFSKLARIVRDDDPLQPDERICLHKVLAEENEYISQVTNWVAWWLAELDEQQKLDALCSNEFVTEVQTLVINSYEINPTVPPMALRLQSKLESTYIDGEKLYMGYLCAAQFLAAIWGLARMKQFGDCFDDLIVDSYGLFVASCTFSSRAELSDLDIPPIDAISIQSRGGQAKVDKRRGCFNDF